MSTGRLGVYFIVLSLVAMGSTVLAAPESFLSPGDVNGDGVLDQNDIFMFSRHFDPDGLTLEAIGDRNGDAVVDQNDIEVVIRHWRYRHLQPPIEPTPIPGEAGTVKGKVSTVTRDGTVIPVPQALVELLSDRLIRRTETDADGQFEFTNVPPGTFVVRAFKEGYYYDREPVTVLAGEEAWVDLFLHPQRLDLGSLAGVVREVTPQACFTYPCEGAPIAGALVRLIPLSFFPPLDYEPELGSGPPDFESIPGRPAPEQATRTDERGFYFFPDIPAGQYLVVVSAVGYSLAEQQTEVIGGEHTFLNFYLEPVPTGILHGKVTELSADGLPGDPIARACVHLFPVLPAEGEPTSGPWSLIRSPYTAVTDENGDYAFPPLPAGPYAVVVHAYAYEPFEGEVEIPPFDQVEVNFQLKPVSIELGAVAGSVWGEPEGPIGVPQPLEGATVLLVYCPSLTDVTPTRGDAAFLFGLLDVSTIVRRATTAADGSYLFENIVPGEYDVVAKKRGFYPDRKHTVVLPGATSEAHFMLQRWQEPEYGAVEGHVLEDPGMLTIVPPPIPGALVVIEPWNFIDPTNYLRENAAGGGEDPPDEALFPRRTLTDENGYYRFDMLPPGGYRVRVMAEGYIPAAKWARVGPGETTTVDFLLVRSTEPPGRVLGHVYEALESGGTEIFPPIPVPGARVTLFPIWSDVGNVFDDLDPGNVPPLPEDYPGSGVLVTFTNESGYYEFPSVPPAAYRIVAEKLGYRPEAHLIQVPPREVVVQDFFLSPAPPEPFGAIGGQVMAASNADVVAPWPIPGAYVFLIPTNHIMPDSPLPDELPPGVQVRITDREGRYYFEQVWPGAYTLLAHAVGYEPGVREVWLAAGERLRVNFFLIPSGYVPTSRFVGHVFEAHTDPSFAPYPIPGALVRLIRQLPVSGDGGGPNPMFLVPVYETLTDERGYFEFAELPAGEYFVEVEAEGFHPFRDIVLLPAGMEVRRTFYLRPLGFEPAILHGFVREATTSSGLPGDPIPGAEVLLVMTNVIPGGDPSLPGVYRAFTNEEGYYRFGAIPPTSYQVAVSAAGFEPFYGHIVLGPGEERQEDFYLRPMSIRPGRVCGVVLTETGPLAGARVSIPLAGAVLSAETDSAGHFCISEVPPGWHRVIAEKEGYLPAVKDVFVPSGGEATVEFFLVPEPGGGTAAFSGVVFEATDPTGSVDPPLQPIEGARVILSLIDPPTFAPVIYEATTDELGEFAIQDIFAPGLYHVLVRAQDCRQVAENIYFAPGDELVREYILHCLPSHIGRMEGRVSADIPGWVGPMLPPIEGALVQLVSVVPGDTLGPVRIYEATTNEMGHYVFNEIVPASYEVTVSAEGFVPASDMVEIIGGETLVRNYALRPVAAENGSISGRVIVNTTYRAIWPIPDATLTLTLPGGGLVASATSDQDGFFSISDVPAGFYVLRAEAKDFFPEERRVEVMSGQDTHVVMRLLQYTPHVGALSGVAHWDLPQTDVGGIGDPAAPIPVANMPVRLISLEYFFPEDYPPILLERITSPAGEFHFPVVPAGRYNLSIGWSGTISYMQEVSVPEGDPTFVTVDVPAPPVILGSLTGRVFTGDNTSARAIEGALVRLVPDGLVLPEIFPPPSFGLDAITDATGHYQIRGIPPGKYNAVVVAEGYLPGHALLEFRPGEEKRHNFPLQPIEPPPFTGRVAGSVSEYTGYLDVFIPIPGALVTLTGSSGIPRQTTTGEYGQFRFFEVPSGHYRISAEKEGYIREEKDTEVPMGDEVWVNFSLHLVDENAAIVIK